MTLFFYVKICLPATPMVNALIEFWMYQLHLWKSEHEIWMLTLYSKSEQATIPGHMLKKIAEAIDNE